MANKEYKPLISRRLLVCLAIIVMIIGLFTDHQTTSVLILMGIMFLVMTITVSMSMGCGACWAGFWLSDDKLNCMERTKEEPVNEPETIQKLNIRGEP